ncbi:MAG: VanZ family protein [Kordia sp.]|uniref:VanZ family protein n=1 Tax=Kordia sp. TaxID=1965332 RepID=UPI00385E0C0F
MRKYIFSAVAVGWTILITILSVIKVKAPEGLHFSYADKLVHGVIYFLVTAVWFFAFTRGITNEKLQKNALVISAVFAFVYGVVIEIVQETFIASRQGDWQDVLANTIGTIVAIIIIKWFIAKDRKLKTQI